MPPAVGVAGKRGLLYQYTALCTMSKRAPPPHVYMYYLTFYTFRCVQMAAEMRAYVFLSLSILLAFSAEDTSQTKHDPQMDVCPSFPLPVANVSDVLSKLQPFLEEAAKNISAALKTDSSPGGAVVSVVYKDSVIWTQGYGLINDSGKWVVRQ